jgi:hypothetical protein
VRLTDCHEATAGGIPLDDADCLEGIARDDWEYWV